MSPNEKTTILIVDDEPNILTTLERALTLEGFNTRTAKDGVEALTRLDGADLVLTDLMMPNMTGIELLHAVKARTPHTPVAIMTAHGTVETALDAMKQGAFDYLLKPCQTEEILLKVRLGLQLVRYEHELARRNEELEALRLELELKNHELERMATTDVLTGLPNRRRFLERYDEELAKNVRYEGKLSLILMDIDHFKAINDRHGHPSGDEVLRRVGALLDDRSRETDLPARVGGEEFAVLLPATDLAGAAEFAESLRSALETHDFGVVGTVTISLGVAEHEAGDEDGTVVWKRADEALYAAKSGGRNRVERAPSG